MKGSAFRITARNESREIISVNLVCHMYFNRDNADKKDEQLHYKLSKQIQQLLAKYFTAETDIDADDVESIDYISEISGLDFRLSTGKIAHVTPADAGFITSLLRLPAEDRMKIMNITYEEIREYQQKCYEETKKKLLDYFSKIWIERTFGEPWTFDPDSNEATFNLLLNKKQIIYLIKKNKVTEKQMNSMIEWFESGKDVTLPDDDNTQS